MTDPTSPTLEHLLAAWAQTQQLSAADAAQIRQAIVPSIPTLSPTWWSDFNTKLSNTITRATTTPVPALAALS